MSFSYNDNINKVDVGYTEITLCVYLTICVIRLCPEDLLLLDWTIQPFVIKLSMVVHQVSWGVLQTNWVLSSR